MKPSRIPNEAEYRAHKIAQRMANLTPQAQRLKVPQWAAAVKAMLNREGTTNR